MVDINRFASHFPYSLVTLCHFTSSFPILSLSSHQLLLLCWPQHQDVWEQALFAGSHTLTYVLMLPKPSEVAPNWMLQRQALPAWHRQHLGHYFSYHAACAALRSDLFQPLHL
jgi:hypothetical protein